MLVYWWDDGKVNSIYGHRALTIERFVMLTDPIDFIVELEIQNAKLKNEILTDIAMIRARHSNSLGE